MYYDERGNYFDYMSQENMEQNVENNIDIKNKDYELNDIDLKNQDMNFDVNNLNVYNFRPAEKLDVTNVVEGFNRGNMFNNLYVPYKNHYYRVMVKGERDSLLLKIQMLTFALYDLNFYLDLNPTNKEALNLYNKYNEECNKFKRQFENKYGPLTACGTKYNNDFTWVKNPWPWDKGGNL